MEPPRPVVEAEVPPDEHLGPCPVLYSGWGLPVAVGFLRLPVVRALILTAGCCWLTSEFCKVWRLCSVEPPLRALQACWEGRSRGYGARCGFCAGATEGGWSLAVVAGCPASCPLQGLLPGSLLSSARLALWLASFVAWGFVLRLRGALRPGFVPRLRGSGCFASVATVLSVVSDALVCRLILRPKKIV